MRFARKSIWIPCLLGAIALAMLVFAWRFPKSPTFAEMRAEEAQRRHEEEERGHSEYLARIRAENAERDAILRPIHEAIERGADSTWGGEYYFHKSIGETLSLLIGADTYAWLEFTDIVIDNGPLPEFWPRGAIRERGTFSVEGSVIHLRPAGAADAKMPHELECRRDGSGRHVRVAGDSRWIDAFVER